MLTPVQAMHSARYLGIPLPSVFETFEQAGVVVRRGQVIMLAGPPGAGKSFLALRWVTGMGTRTLYISADTDAYTMTTRLASMRTGHSLAQVEQGIRTGYDDYYAEAVAETKGLSFSFEPAPTLEDIELELLAYQEVWGDYPEVIVIDNLMNVAGVNDNEWSALREVSKFLHYVARETEALVMALHHTSESEGAPEVPAARRAVQGKISQLPEMILTVAIDPYVNDLRVASVKNRTGPADASGRKYISLHCVPEKMHLEDVKQPSFYDQFKDYTERMETA